MKPITFPDANLVLGPPESMPDCTSIPCHFNREIGLYVSLWEADPMDRHNLNVGNGHIWLYVYGGMHPPIAMVPSTRVVQKDIRG